MPQHAAVDREPDEDARVAQLRTQVDALCAVLAVANGERSAYREMLSLALQTLHRSHLERRRLALRLQDRWSLAARRTRQA